MHCVGRLLLRILRVWGLGFRALGFGVGFRMHARMQGLQTCRVFLAGLAA